MAYDYKGTKLTGTSTTAKTFSKSGISHARVGQLYFNKQTGHVYKCTVGGKASEAKWKYARTDICGKPKTGVTGLGAPVRQNNNHVMKADWKVPSKLTNKKNGRRATGQKITWTLGVEGKDPKKIIETTNEAKKSSQINLNSLTIGKEQYSRSSFYPEGKILDTVSVTVVPTNDKGAGKVKATASREFKTPRMPSFSGWTFAADGTLSNTITTDAGNDYRERYDTWYQLYIEDTSQGEPWYEFDTSDTATTITPTYDVTNYQQLSYDDYVRATLTAWARGYAGDSKKERSTYYVSFPAQTSILDVHVSDRGPTGKCTVFVDTNTTDNPQHPVDSIKLEYLANCDYADETAIPGDAGWTDSDIFDNGDCTALSVAVTNLIPDPGKYTWVRVKSIHAIEAVLYRYSKPWRVTQLETPAATAADETITILDTEAGEDGESIVVHLGWDPDGTDDATGTELTWSEYEDSWRSTEEPDAYSFTWEDLSNGQPVPVTVDNVTYRHSATITIKGLEESTMYFIKARRYLEGDTTTYSDYSNTATQLTSEMPESVVAYCDSYVAANGALNVSWTFSGHGLQTSWQIIDSNGTTVKEGQSSLGSTQIDAARIAELATGGVLSFTVQVSTGSAYVVSEEHTVTIVDPPTLSLSGSATLTAQPFGYIATCSSECDLTMIITSQGAVSQFPEGLRRQTAGDTIYSDVVTPEWTASGAAYTTAVTCPTGLDFWNQTTYTLEVTATDRETGLQSETVTTSFTVNWSDPAVPPVTLTYALTADTTVDEDVVYYESTADGYVEVTPEGSEDPAAEGWYVQTDTAYVALTPIDTVDDAGFHHQAVQIDLTPPAGSSQTDVYDIYRMTGDGAYLIGESFPLTFTATDEYAPFGDDLTLTYRFAIRTEDGDVAFSDIEYTANGSVMRFDWSGGSLELPYNISIGDSYTKDVEIRAHMDGSNDAYWNENITRTGSLSSDLIRLSQQEDIDLARALARYAGAVFVRTPDGSAYEADVQVSDMSTEGILTAIAIDATEIGLTQEFSLPIPYELGD